MESSSVTLKLNVYSADGYICLRIIAESKDFLKVVRKHQSSVETHTTLDDR